MTFKVSQFSFDFNSVVNSRPFSLLSTSDSATGSRHSLSRLCECGFFKVKVTDHVQKLAFAIASTRTFARLTRLSNSPIRSPSRNKMSKSVYGESLVTGSLTDPTNRATLTIARESHLCDNSHHAINLRIYVPPAIPQCNL